MEKNTQNSGTKEIGSCHARLLIDSSVAERLWSHLCVKLLLTLHAPFAIKKEENRAEMVNRKVFQIPVFHLRIHGFSESPMQP